MARVRELCDRHDIILIFDDELITGFGRIRRLFAAEHFGIWPDIIVLGKGTVVPMLRYRRPFLPSA